MAASGIEYTANGGERVDRLLERDPEGMADGHPPCSMETEASAGGPITSPAA